MSEAAARATQANAPANASGRPSVIQLVFREKGALYAANRNLLGIIRYSA